MDKNIIENIRYKFELKKLIGNELSSSMDINSEIRSDPWVDDLDLLPSTPNSELEEDKIDNNISYSDLYSKDNEDKLMEENIDLYNDLIKIEEEEKKSKQIHEAEFKNCKTELEKLKETDIKNKKRIEELTKENTNLKISISSLFRTIKREIAFKDKSLTEANTEVTRLENMLKYRNGDIFKNGKCLYCGNNCDSLNKDSSTSKRKRSESPDSSYKRRDYKSAASRTYKTDLQSEKHKDKYEKRSEHETTKDKHSSELLDNKDKKDDCHKQVSKYIKLNKETQTSNQCVFCQTYDKSNDSKNSRETNDMFFSLLPDSLKKSFYDYEQDQMISLNKLKESFIDEYFNSIRDIPSPDLETTSKTQESRTDTEPLNKSVKAISSSSSVSTSKFRHRKKSKSSRRYRKRELDEDDDIKDYSQNHAPKVPKNCYNSRLAKKDLVSLFMYRKEKIPFAEKRKFGLDKEDKKLIPEKLL